MGSLHNNIQNYFDSLALIFILYAVYVVSTRYN